MAVLADYQNKVFVLKATHSVMDNYSRCSSALSKFLKTCKGAGKQMFCKLYHKIL